MPGDTQQHAPTLRARLRGERAATTHVVNGGAEASGRHCGDVASSTQAAWLTTRSRHHTHSRRSGGLANPPLLFCARYPTHRRRGRLSASNQTSPIRRASPPRPRAHVRERHMARRKIVVASMMHETNTFSPVPTPLASFRPLTGAQAVEEFKDTNTQFGGFLQVAESIGAEIVVPIAAGAHPSGYVERRAYEDMCEAIVGATRRGCDAAFLALHGAMVAEHTDDGEGELLRRIRALAPRLPIAVGLDFHAHMTAPMVESATVITGYRTYPHIDMAETAQRAGRTLIRALN